MLGQQFRSLSRDERLEFQSTRPLKLDGLLEQSTDHKNQKYMKALMKASMIDLT